MKYIITAFFIIAFLHLNAQDMSGMKMPMPPKKAQKKKVDEQSSEVYTCVMHPKIHLSKPGNCPICGMKLVKEKPKPNAMSGMKGMDMVKDSSMKMDKNMNGMSGMKMNGMDNMPMGTPVKLEMKTLVNNTPPRIVHYDLYVRDTMVNYTGRSRRAIAVNGQIPMPTLTFTEGDTAEIVVHNELNEVTAMHWHGLILPNEMDGVPFLTQMPIKPHTNYVYRFPIVQHGTHWYHSHSGLQEQIGMYGTFIMNKRAEWYIPTIPVVLSDWIDMRPKEVDRSLHTQTDWFGIKKNTIQSYSEAIQSGNLKTKITNEWKRMTAMDVSDIAYDRFLINGKNQIEQSQFKKGDKVRLRIANGAASSYFWLTYSGGKITVVATDGNDVEPIEVDRLLIAVSETFDVLVTIPDSKSYEFLVTPEDRTKSASLWLGSGEKVQAKKLPKLNYFAGMKMMNGMMDMNGNMKQMEGMQMANQAMDMNAVMYPENRSNDMLTLNYAMLKAPEKTTLPSGPLKQLYFELTGNMNRYVWSINNKVVSEADKILIKKGENVRIILYNNTMMRHPMHLHGHDFRLLNGRGEYSILKNIIDIMPMERDTIEFAATQSGDWFFHCHILYHMMSGMGRVFSYENSPANPELPNATIARRGLNSDDRMFHFMSRIGIETMGTDGEAMLANTRYKLSEMWHLGYHDMHGYENETMLGRYLGRMQWWYPYVGFDYHYKMPGGPNNLFGNDEKNWLGQKSNKNNRHTVVAGIAYTLPLLIIADARADGNGKFRFQLSRQDIPLTPRMRSMWMINTDKEYTLGLRYIITKYFSLSTHYDSDMGFGLGLTLTY